MPTIEPFQQRMGWTFTWVSCAGSDFNDDMGVTIDEDAGLDEYNYQDVGTLKDRGRIFIDKGELPGLSVFLRDGDRVFHSYSTYQLGLDHLMNIYNYLDLTPLGRQEDNLPYTMAWVRHHDRYPQHDVGPGIVLGSTPNARAVDALAGYSRRGKRCTPQRPIMMWRTPNPDGIRPG
jgi:predicted dithiol-disulfide oxidoreductase (DUF899 family)